MEKNKIIVFAYAVYPNIPSSEGIVNSNWIDIVSKNNDLVVLDSESTQYYGNNDYKSKEDFFLKTLKKIIKNKNSLSNFLYRLLNKVFKLIIKSKEVNSLYTFIWVRRRKNKIKQFDDSNCVFWARLLPTFSILPLIQFYREKKIPIVVNVNDPLENDLYSKEIILKSIPIVQCWTFPSYPLSKEFSDRYEIDIEKCFVVPHAMKEQNNLYQNSFGKDKLTFLYTGTFYKGAFTESFLKQLYDFSKTEYYREVKFTFVLSQYDLGSLELLKKILPNLTVLTNLSRDEVLKMIVEADCMLVVDAKEHVNLLKGKLAEAISFGIPVFSVSYKGSVMDKIVSNYGGFSSYHDVENQIFNDLKKAVESLTSTSWNKNFLNEREVIMNYFSEKNILELTDQVVRFAKNKFYN
ncbi:MAG: hypothetical protein ACK4M1_05385 [Flavobacterium sp.]